jgi:hypothetical protein
LWQATRLARRVYTALYVFVCFIFGAFYLTSLVLGYLLITGQLGKPLGLHADPLTSWSSGARAPPVRAGERAARR